jgi:hypothetical protein
VKGNVMFECELCGFRFVRKIVDKLWKMCVMEKCSECGCEIVRIVEFVEGEGK